jgi:hypothetical protein
MAPFFAGDVLHDAQKQFQSKTDLRSQIAVRVTGKKNQRHADDSSRRTTKTAQRRAINLAGGAIGQIVPFSFATFLLGKQKKSRSSWADSTGNITNSLFEDVGTW